MTESTVAGPEAGHPPETSQQAIVQYLRQFLSKKLLCLFKIDVFYAIEWFLSGENNVVLVKCVNSWRNSRIGAIC